MSGCGHVTRVRECASVRACACARACAHVCMCTRMRGRSSARLLAAALPECNVLDPRGVAQARAPLHEARREGLEAAAQELGGTQGGAPAWGCSRAWWAGWG